MFMETLACVFNPERRLERLSIDVWSAAELAAVRPHRIAGDPQKGRETSINQSFPSGSSFPNRALYFIQMAPS